MPPSSIEVGLALGNGTGAELAAVFERVLVHMAAAHGISINFVRSDRVYHSYSSLLAVNDADAVTDETLKDAAHYRKFCEDVSARGVAAIFRTSISAQALYMVRDQLQAVKVEHFPVTSTSSVMLVRDQAQGFYSGTNTVDPAGESVTRTTGFRRDVFERLVRYGMRRAREAWGDETPSTVTLVYKFHLFDGLFQQWSQKIERDLGVRVRFIQGDTMNRDLLAFGVTGRMLLIAANEYADIMQTIMLDRFRLGPQEHACAENIYLGPEVNGGLSEYQTAHGSADDIAGRGIVNPVATVRSAAAILQDHAGCHGEVQRLNDALDDVWANGVATPDQGGSATTEVFTDELLRVMELGAGRGEAGRDAGRGDSDEEVATLATSPNTDSKTLPSAITTKQSRSSRPTGRAALVVVDFQNDFANQYKDQAAVARVRANVPRALAWARQAGIEVMHVRFLGDEQYQQASLRLRNQAQGRAPWCVSGTPGADFIAGAGPIAGERVFTKKALYDPFLEATFELYIAQRRFQHLIVAGLFADVCVDATVRGAFQRGLLATVVRGCTLGLHFSEDQMLEYMGRVYGSDVVEVDHLPVRESARL